MDLFLCTSWGLFFFIIIVVETLCCWWQWLLLLSLLLNAVAVHWFRYFSKLFFQGLYPFSCLCFLTSCSANVLTEIFFNTRRFYKQTRKRENTKPKKQTPFPVFAKWLSWSTSSTIIKSPIETKIKLEVKV